MITVVTIPRVEMVLTITLSRLRFLNKPSGLNREPLRGTS